MQWKHYRLSCKWVNSTEHTTHSYNTSNRSGEGEKKKWICHQQSALLKIRVAPWRERRASTFKCKYWHFDSPRHIYPLDLSRYSHLTSAQCYSRWGGGVKEYPAESFKCKILTESWLWKVCALFLQRRRHLGFTAVTVKAKGASWKPSRATSYANRSDDN